MKNIFINGKKQKVEKEMSISELLKLVNVPTAGTAVAVNDAIISKMVHDTHLIKEGDQIEIMRAIGGG